MGRATSDKAPPPDDVLVEREREAELLRAAIEQGAHLVTVTGTFGVGKTALVRDVVRRPILRDGETLVPVVVDLSEASTGEAMLDAIAQSLGRAGRTGRGGVGKALASAGPTLLVLDPFDRLVEESVRLRSWLDDAPELSVVVVSRERLGVAGEQIVEVAPLSSDEGARLLAALGARHRGQFAPTEGERAALARIAERLDGIPLAIELAAPRLSVMGPDALLYRLENRWEVLRRSGRATDRHATLEASLGWSLELLEPGTREVLAALTVFRGGMTIDAAEAVIPAPASTGVLDALQSLRARSLVSVVDDGTSPDLRLALLSSVRDLAQRDLASDRRARLEERHASYYVELAEREARAAEERGSPSARARLSRERENLLAVVRAILGRGAVSSAAADRALRALCAVGPSLLAEGASAELVRDLELGLSVARGSGADPRLIARALTLRAELAEARGERMAAERDLSEALVLSHHARDASLEARVLLAASESAVHAGEPSRAAAAIGRAKELGRGSLEPHLATRALWLEGAVAEACRDPIGARLAVEESLARARALDLPFVELDAIRALALLDLREGALDALAGRILEGRTLLAQLPHARSHAFLALAPAVHAASYAAISWARSSTTRRFGRRGRARAARRVARGPGRHRARRGRRARRGTGRPGRGPERSGEPRAGLRASLRHRAHPSRPFGGADRRGRRRGARRARDRPACAGRRPRVHDLGRPTELRFGPRRARRAHARGQWRRPAFGAARRRRTAARTRRVVVPSAGRRARRSLAPQAAPPLVGAPRRRARRRERRRPTLGRVARGRLAGREDARRRRRSPRARRDLHAAEDGPQRRAPDERDRLLPGARDPARVGPLTARQPRAEPPRKHEGRATTLSRSRPASPGHRSRRIS